MSQVPISAHSEADLLRLSRGDGYCVSSPAWGKIAILTVLVAAIFWSSLLRLWNKTNPIYGEANWGHSFIVPLIGLYYLYLNREELFRSKIKPLVPGAPNRMQLISGLALLACGAGAKFVAGPMLASLRPYLEVVGYALMLLGGLVLLLNWGVGSLVFGLLTFGYGIWPGQNDYVKDLGLVITIFGIVLTTCGWQVMKIAWFPIAFLICAIPWPGLVYSWIASPLQQLAATVSVFVLNLTGIDSRQIGTKIFIPTNDPLNPRTLNVAEACAGLRSLMTFITIGGAVAFLSSRPLWQKFFITLSAIPIAVLCNVMRVSGQGLLDTYVSTELTSGEAHTYVGLLMLIPALFLLLGVGWVLDQLFVEEAEAKVVKATKPPEKLKRKLAAPALTREIEPAQTGPGAPRRPHLGESA